MSTNDTDSSSTDGARGGRHARPPGDWGDQTKQTHPEWPWRKDQSVPDQMSEKHTDTDEIRRKFGIGRFDVSDFEDYETPYANCLLHTTDGRYFGHVGGTNCLAIGKKGSGKSTLGLHIAQRLMDERITLPAWAIPDTQPDEPDVSEGESAQVQSDPDAVVWRGQPSASEWLPYKPWTTLHLPKHADIDATWEPNDMRKTGGQPADLASEVREVRRYDNPTALNKALDPGKFHVVYPDPSFSGCEEIMRNSNYCDKPVPFQPSWEGPAEETTPVVEWWFAFFVARLENGPYDWTTVVFDEAADLAPDSAANDFNMTYEKVKSLRKVMAHSRKHYLSLIMFAHREDNVHYKIRGTFDWRASMPDGTANLCANNNDSAPVGFNDMPMLADMLSDRPIGYGLWWNETNFTRFTWDDIPDWDEDENRWLQIDLNRPRSGRKSPGGGT